MDFKAKRKELKMSQTEIAVKVGVSLTSYQNWERGACKPAGENKSKLYKLFGIVEK